MFSIVIVTWQNEDYARKLIDSIHKKSYYNGHEIILVYNGEEPLKANGGMVGHFVKGIVLPTNRGLSYAANHGAEYATKDFICLIDDDMEVLKDWDKALEEAYRENKEKTNWVSSTCIEPIAPHYNISTKDYENGARPEKWYHNISNTPLLIPHWFWRKICGYDLDFPNSGAELGLAKRAYDNGERLFLQTPHSMVIHHQSQSFKKLPGLKKARVDRDIKFKEKHGITRQEFVKLIKKGEIYPGSIEDGQVVSDN